MTSQVIDALQCGRGAGRRGGLFRRKNEPPGVGTEKKTDYNG